MPRLLGLVLAVLVLGLRAGDAEAKAPSFVISGGELGPYAAVVYPPWPEGPYLPLGAPMSQLALTERPAGEPPLRYDLYDRGLHGAAERPSYSYYPAVRLLYDREYDRWYDVLPAWSVFMGSAIDDALARKARGELEVGHLATELRARHLPQVTYWLRPAASATLDYPRALSSCEECIFLGVSGEEFIMSDLLETLSGAPRRARAEPPAYVIEYYGIVEPPHGGIGGRLGYYSPPSDERAGRFWPRGFGPDALFFETSPGFDAAIAQALSREDGPADEPSGSSLDSEGSGYTTTLVGAGAALGVVVVGAGVVRGLARRRG